MERLEESKNMEAAERQKLEDEIRMKQEEVMRIQTEVDQKDEETRRLQDEVEEARRKQEEVSKFINMWLVLEKSFSNIIFSVKGDAITLINLANGGQFNGFVYKPKYQATPTGQNACIIPRIV